METISGWMEYELQNVGSKSEGNIAILKCDGGKEYTLYRVGKLPLGDDFFLPYHGKKIIVEGVAEERNGYFCVHTISEDVETKQDKKRETTIES